LGKSLQQRKKAGLTPTKNKCTVKRGKLLLPGRRASVYDGSYYLPGGMLLGDYQAKGLRKNESGRVLSQPGENPRKRGPSEARARKKGREIMIELKAEYG